MEKNNIEIAKQLILKHFTFLTSQGYTVDFELKNYKIYSECLIVRFKSEEKKREISISYSKGEINDDIKYDFDADIVRIPYIDATKDFFSLNVYLDSIKSNFSTSLHNDFKEEDADKIVGKLAKVLQIHASKIIDGTEWVEGYYPRWN